MTLPAGAASMLSRVYGRLATWRRRSAARRPDLRRRLRSPVVSVGNLAVGGRGKTPVVASVAALLRDAGERPAVLSRGYARQRVTDGVTIVRTPEHLVGSLDTAGDEPFMLARALDGVAVLVAEDRHLAGCVAEARLGCSVHVLDDGFQHFRLARDVDLLLATPGDLRAGKLLPAGWLREPVDAARAASALLVVEGTVADVAAIVDTLGIARRFEVRQHLTVPRMVEPYGTPPRHPRSAPAIAVAGIARPERFFEDLVAGGWNLVARVAFADHHRYSLADVRAVAERATAAGAVLVLTTEKDVVRWLPLAPLPFPLAWVPVQADVAPAGEFRSWLLGRIEAARTSAGSDPGPGPLR